MSDPVTAGTPKGFVAPFNAGSWSVETTPAPATGSDPHALAMRGTYDFRARLRRPANGHYSDSSPVKSVVAN